MNAPYYQSGDGFVLNHGMKLDRSLTALALAKHLAVLKNPFASALEHKLAEDCIDQITEAMKASFPENVEALR